MGKVSISYCVNVMSLATVTNGHSALLNFDKSKIIYSV